MANLKIKLVRGFQNGRKDDQIATALSLGLRKSATRLSSRIMQPPRQNQKISHLVEVTEA